MMIYDGHLDLSMNALEWNRDLRWSVEEIRESEKGMVDKPDRGKNTVSFPAMQEGNIAFCNATLIARYVKKGNPLPGWHSPEQAWAQTQGQLAWYNAMEYAGELVQIRDLETLAAHMERYESTSGPCPIGYLLTLEGADSIISMEHLEWVWEAGLRAVGPAHYGPGVYAQGTDATGGIGARGRELLDKMAELEIILDVTHLCDDSYREAMDHFNGPVWASHSNARVFVPHNRQFTDDQLQELIERDAVIGAALDTWMMVPDWERGVSDPKEMGASLDIVVKNIDHVCQLAGDSLHAAIGSDLDGAFGKEQSPYDLETIAGLSKIPSILKEWGYSEEDTENIMFRNWINFLERVWA